MDEMTPAGAVQAHFESEAPEYDDIIGALIPHYGQMLSALVRALPFSPSDAIRVVDLGCGTGSVTLAIVSAFPSAQVTCVDIAAPMIERARQRLRGRSNLEFVVADFSSMAFDGPYDAMVSSLALHHLRTDAEKRAFYGRVRDALRPDGVFYNADIVLGASEVLQHAYMMNGARSCVDP